LGLGEQGVELLHLSPAGLLLLVELTSALTEFLAEEEDELL
jgi:hypothetical protein